MTAWATQQFYPPLPYPSSGSIPSVDPAYALLHAYPAPLNPSWYHDHWLERCVSFSLSLSLTQPPLCPSTGYCSNDTSFPSLSRSSLPLPASRFTVSCQCDVPAIHLPSFSSLQHSMILKVSPPFPLPTPPLPPLLPPSFSPPVYLVPTIRVRGPACRPSQRLSCCGVRIPRLLLQDGEGRRRAGIRAGGKGASAGSTVSGRCLSERPGRCSSWPPGLPLRDGEERMGEDF